MTNLRTTQLPGAAGPLPNPARSRLLVIDDDEGVRAAVSVVLEEEFDVSLANDGQQGLACAAQQPVDVVVLDLDLPGLTGIEILERLKHLDPLIEVIILTGQGTLETARQAMQLGAFAYLSKPFETQECRRVMRAANERRQKMLHWRALELELHRREVEQEIERTKSEIYATVIHDLNSPLTTAMGLLELMRIDVDSGAVRPADLAQQLNDAGLQLKFCSGIIQRYLGFMRRSPGQVAAADLAGVMADLKKLVRAHAAVKQHQLIVHVPDEHLTVAVNGVDLLQVLLNLTVNALQASEQRHHVEVYCRHWPGGTPPGPPAQGAHDLWLHPERIAGPMASVTVQDDGAGIPAEALPLVLRSYHTTKQPGEGTGLGLTVIQRIVTENGGALHVHSIVGEGTAFTVFFPLAG